MTKTTFLFKLHKPHAVMMAGCAIILAWVAYFALHHIIETAAGIAAVLLLIEAGKKWLSDPVQLAIATDLAKADTWAKSELGFDPTGVTTATKSSTGAAVTAAS